MRRPSDRTEAAESGAPARLARAVGEHMFARDRAAQALGIELDAIGPGHARMRMTVRADMLNGHGMCHGGLIFTFADSCFAYACNSRNRVTVAAACSIDFLGPAAERDRLVADCREQSLGGRIGVYDVVVTHDDGRRIALFRGKSYRVTGEVIAAAASPQLPQGT